MNPRCDGVERAVRYEGVSRISRIGSRVLVALSLLMPSALPVAAQTVEAIRARGHVICGVTPRQPGFGEVDDKGRWKGFDVDFCSALAAATLGRSDAFRVHPVIPTDRHGGLEANEIDVLVRGAEMTLSRDAAWSTRFAGVLYYEAQGLMLARTQSIESALELSGATLCTESNAASIQAVSDFFTSRRMRHRLLSFEKTDEILAAYSSRRCNTITADMYALATMRLRLPQPSEHIILPERLSLAAFGPIVARSDDTWATIVRWTINALIGAEDLGLTRATIDTMRTAPSLSVRRFLGAEGELGAPLGLVNDFAARIVRAVGNYGEMFDRNLGRRSYLLLERGANNLWRSGGLHYAPPLR